MIFTKKDKIRWDNMKARLDELHAALSDLFSDPKSYSNILLILNQCLSGLVIKKQPLYVTGSGKSYYVTNKGLTYQNYPNSVSIPIIRSKWYVKELLENIINTLNNTEKETIFLANLDKLEMPKYKKEQIIRCKEIFNDVKKLILVNTEKNKESVCLSLSKEISPITSPDQINLTNDLFIPPVINKLMIVSEYNTKYSSPNTLFFTSGGWQSSKIQIQEFINLSEPQIYDACMEWFGECIIKVKTLIAAKERPYVTFIEKYSEYIVAYNLAYGRV